MFSWLFKQSKNEEVVEILGDYDPGDARVEDLVNIYSSIKKKTDYSNALLKELEGTSSDDMIGDETARIKELIVKCYADLNEIDLEGKPYEVERKFREHIVFSKCAAMIIPILIRLEAVDEARDLFSEIKINQIRDALVKKHSAFRGQGRQ
jgi:hypothetical protein